MKIYIAAIGILAFASCDSVQRGDLDHSDSTNAKMDTTSINYTPERSDSTQKDSTAILNTDSSYVK